ncbi:MAG: hypothetical protein HQM10_24895 [Candidatus Riflebacteria bacterium]|nr:hypothetical protein [Candidatus Riflebacteria bacterium]
MIAIRNKNTIRNSTCIVLLTAVFSWSFCMLSIANISPDTLRMQSSLENAFLVAFSNSDALNSTRVFDILGYTDEQKRTITNVVPKPSSLSVSFEPDLSGPGKFNSIEVLSRNTHFYKLIIDSCKLNFNNVNINSQSLESGRILFNNFGQLGIETRVATTEILKLFEYFSDARKISNLKMTMKNSEILVSGTIKKGFFPVEFHSYGKPVLVGNDKINFRCRRLTVNGLPMPNAIIESIFSKINPVFDVKRTSLKLVLKNVEAKDGYIITNADLR